MVNSPESDPASLSARAFLTPDKAANLANEAVEIVLVPLDVETDAFHALAAWLQQGERCVAERFHFERDRRRFIVARGRLRQILGARLGIEPRAIELAYTAHGKPMLAAGSASIDLRFNVSHCKDMAVFAFCRGREVGIDMEMVERLEGIDEIAAHFFSRNELAAYRSLDEADKLAGFFNCWTRKEAFIKALGEGLHFPLGSFDVSLAPRDPARILRVGDRDGADCGWCLRSFSPLPGYVAAVVVERCRAAANDEAFVRQPTCTLWTQ